MFFVVLTFLLQVFVNNEFYVDFSHREDPTRISVLNITGSVNILDVECLQPVVGRL
jgi:hypothetical protein